MLPSGRSSSPQVGPIFVSGRQHSGNTVLVHVLGRADGCLAFAKDHGFFEHRALIDRIANPSDRARYAISEIMLDRKSPELHDEVSEWIERWIQSVPQATAIEIYQETMRYATEISGKRYWVQKATSYIFYADEVLSQIPNSKMVYLLRNPFDIGASRKLRKPTEDRLFELAVSWNRGIRIARRLSEAQPDRFKIVRYEDLVRDPEQEIEEVFGFLGIEFDRSCLDVPHVNRADQPGPDQYVTGHRGLNASRVHYYMNELTGAERAALDFMLRKSPARDYYPDLPHLGESRSLRDLAMALQQAVFSPVKHVVQQMRRYGRSPAYLLHRTWKRIRAYQ